MIYQREFYRVIAGTALDHGAPQFLIFDLGELARRGLLCVAAGIHDGSLSVGSPHRLVSLRRAARRDAVRRPDPRGVLSRVALVHHDRGTPMTCARGPSLPPGVCRYLEDHDRYFSTERCYIRERPLDLDTDAGWRAVAAFNRRRADVCRRALSGWRGSYSFCVGGALSVWLRDQPVPRCAS